MNTVDKNFLDLLIKVGEGNHKTDRTGTGTVSIHGHEMRFDLREGFPLLSLKKTNFKAILNEFLWMVVHGSTDVTWLNERGHTFWDEWVDENNTIGRGYGHQFRKYGEMGDEYSGKNYVEGIDQVQKVIDSIKNNPDSRRHLLTTWNPVDLNKMQLPPCHGISVQFVTCPIDMEDRIQMFEQSQGRKPNSVEEVFESTPKFYLDLFMNQRSADLMLGVPFNIAFYSIFLEVVAKLTNTCAREFIWYGVDVHVYDNHTDGVLECFSRGVEVKECPQPMLFINPEINNINDIKFEDFELVDYKPLPHIKLPVAI